MENFVTKKNNTLDIVKTEKVIEVDELIKKLESLYLHLINKKN